MGSFAEWMMVRANSSNELRTLLGQLGADVRGETSGWTIARTRNADPSDLVASVVQATHAPSLAGWIYDSDFGFISAAGADGSFCELVIGEPYDTDGDGEENDLLSRLASPEGRRDSAVALSTWSDKNAAAPMVADDAFRILAESHVFAEEGVTELLKGLGLPDPLPLL